MALEETGRVWCLDWAIEKFMPQSAGPSPTYLEGVLPGGLEGFGIGLRWKRGLGYLPLRGSRLA